MIYMNFTFLSKELLNLNNLKIKFLQSLSKCQKFEKIFIILWFSGPFFYLLERDPADIWLTLICISFLFRSFLKKTRGWLNQLWVKITFLFWFWCLISSLLSPDPLFSFQQSFVWIRFPLYAMAIQSWVGSRQDFKEIMLIFIFFGMLIMNFILISEMIFEPKHRLSWPYGDFVPGHI